MSAEGCAQKSMVALGLGLVFVSLPVVILLIYGILTGGHVLAFLIAAVMLLMPAMLFLFFGTRDKSDRPMRIDKSMERRVLHLAAINDGELTAAKLALSSQLLADDCQKVLERFEALGLARSRIGSQGEMRYSFPQLQESLEEEGDDFMRRLLDEEDPDTLLDLETDASFDLHFGSQDEEISIDAPAHKKGDDN